MQVFACVQDLAQCDANLWEEGCAQRQLSEGGVGLLQQAL